jgi:hypothetical protein
VKIEEARARMIDSLSFEIMNATADDWESLDQIYPTVCRVFSQHSRQAIVDTVSKLVIVGWLEQRQVDGQMEECWFRMTDEGRRIWQLFTNADTHTE